MHAASLQTLVRAGIGRLWATPDRIRSVDDAVRQWTTLQMIAADRADAEAHARHSTEQVRARAHHQYSLLPTIFSTSNFRFQCKSAASYNLQQKHILCMLSFHVRCNHMDSHHS